MKFTNRMINYYLGLVLITLFSPLYAAEIELLSHQTINKSLKLSKEIFKEKNIDINNTEKPVEILSKVGNIDDIEQCIPFIDSKKAGNIYYEVRDIAKYMGRTRICSGRLSDNREDVSRTTLIALKITREKKTFLQELCTYLLLIDMCQYTPFYPRLFGFYSTNQSPSELLSTETNKNNKNNIESYVLEMEYVETTLEHQSISSSQLVGKFCGPSTLFFELYLGEWAAQYYAGIHIGDNQHSNIGLQKNIPFIRLYHIDDDIYAIDEPWMPVRIDFEETYLAPKKNETLKYYYSNMPPCRSLDEVGKNFLEELQATKKQNLINDFFIINLIKKYFSHLKINANKWKSTKEVRHYYSLKVK